MTYTNGSTRGSEWFCDCSANIRAASLEVCLKCGARRPTDSGGFRPEINAFRSLEEFDRLSPKHGRLGAMALILKADRERRG